MSLSKTNTAVATAQSTANTANTTANSTATNLANNYTSKYLPDTRSVNQNPQWYFTNYPKQIITEFKTASVIGLSGETYASLETTVPWTDSSGGWPKQAAKIAGREYWRVATSTTAWGAWSDALGLAGVANSAASTAQSTANTANSTANTAKTNAATAQSTADTAKTNASTAQSTANTANSTANTAKANAATAQTTANTARAEAAAAAKTATSVAEITTDGVTFGNKLSGAWSGFRSRMAAGAFQVLDAAGAVSSSFGSNEIQLGNNSYVAVIKMCGGLANIYGTSSGEVNIAATKSNLIMRAASNAQLSGYDTYITANRNIYLTPDFDVLIKGNPVYGSKILYDNASGAVCPISLNESSANFAYVDVYYGKLDGTQGGYKCARVHAPNGKRFILDQANPVSSQEVLQLVSARMRFSGAQIVNEYNGYAANHYKGIASVGTSTEDSAIKIYRVVGYK